MNKITIYLGNRKYTVESEMSPEQLSEKILTAKAMNLVTVDGKDLVLGRGALQRAEFVFEKTV